MDIKEYMMKKHFGKSNLKKSIEIFPDFVNM
jgi:hypothetical protein